MTTSRPATGKPRELVIRRLIEAPPSVVFELWTDPAHLVKWWGPKDFIASDLTFDVRPGGSYRARIWAEHYGTLWMSGVYREVVKPNRLVFTFAWDEKDGRRGHETLVTVTFEERDGKTDFTFRQGMFPDAAACDSHRGGWTECFDRMDQYITGFFSTKGTGS